MRRGRGGAMPLRDRQAEPPAGRCGWCGGEVYAGEPVYRPEEGRII